MAKVDQASSGRRVGKALSTLSGPERRVFVLAVRAGLSNRQIAERLELPLVQIERLLASALYRFDRALRKETRTPWWKVW